MTFVDALILIAGLLAVTVAVGVAVRWRAGRPRRTDGDEAIEPHRLGADRLGEQATLLQFSTEKGSHCPTVHRTLHEIAAEREGVLHLDIDLTHRPDIAKHFNVLQTPTTLILDRRGVVQTRFGGAPRRDVVELELTRVSKLAHA